MMTLTTRSLRTISYDMAILFAVIADRNSARCHRAGTRVIGVERNGSVNTIGAGASLGREKSSARWNTGDKSNSRGWDSI